MLCNVLERQVPHIFLGLHFFPKLGDEVDKEQKVYDEVDDSCERSAANECPTLNAIASIALTIRLENQATHNQGAAKAHHYLCVPIYCRTHNLHSRYNTEHTPMIETVNESVRECHEEEEGPK